MNPLVFITKQALAYIAIGLLALGIGGYAFLKNGNGAETAFTVVRGAFLQQISVSGKVVAAAEVDLGFSQSGRVAGVYAAVGKQVPVGTVLAALENGDLRAAVLQKEAALEREEAKLDSLKAGTRPEELAVAEADVSGDREALLNELKKSYTAADDAIRNQLDQFISNARTANPQLTFTSSDSQSVADVQNGRVAIEKALSDWKASLDALSLSSDLSVAVVQAQSNQRAAAALLSDAATALSGANTNQIVTETLISGYVADVKSARESVDSAIASLSAAVSALDASVKSLALKRAGSTAADVAAQAAQVKAAEADVANARAALRKTLIFAPFSGVVTVVDAKAGKIVSSNAPEISMMSAGAYQIESFVPEVHVALLETGDAASVTLDAYGERVPFKATVVSIDPAETVRDGVSTYRAVLEFKEKDERIRAGMTANVVITTEKKEGVISVPEGAVFERGGKKFVYVKEGGQTVERAVTAGSVSSLGEAEILSGLSEGETVVLKAAGE